MTAAPLHQQALDQLGQEIASGRLAVGSVITLAEIEHRFLISRTVAREIMRVLEALKMIESRRRVGITITPRSTWNALDPLVVSWRLSGPDRLRCLIEVAELRAGLQPVAGELAARHASPAQRDRLTDLAAIVAAVVPEHPEAVQAAVEFHCLLLNATGSDLLANIADLVRLVDRDVILIVRPGKTDPRWGLRFGRIAAAVVAGDEDMARRWSHEQARFVLRGLTERAPGARPRPAGGPGAESWSV